MLPSSGSLSIGQIYQECGGSAFAADENIRDVRDLWWFADMPSYYSITYDDNNGFAYANGTISTTHPFRNTVDVDVYYDVGIFYWNGFNYESTPYTTAVIPQFSNSTGTIFINYNCFSWYNCFLSSVYNTGANPVWSGDYLYSTSFADYYGKTRYNQYIAV